ncbi:MAG: hypothetical protein ACLFPR_04805 [Desulfococcaceae bacterium]
MTDSFSKDEDRAGKEGGRNFLNTPLSARGVPARVVYLMAVVGGIYLLNPTAGLLEIIPDTLPLIGNLDEGGATLAVWYGLLEFLEGRRKKRDRAKAGDESGA